jgi:hypothetical protein
MLLIDADIIAYRVGWACNDETEEVALRNLHSFAAQCIAFISSELEEYEMYLTGSGNFRHEYAVTAPYKGNRKDSAKPVHLQAIRDELVKSWGAVITVDEEADDAIAIAATEIQYVQTPMAADVVMCSVDKDFFQIPGVHYNFVKHTTKVVTEEEGLFNFYSQVLTGDRVDNIIGLHGIGEVKAGKILSACETEPNYLEQERCYFVACVKAYTEKEELDPVEASKRVVENARMLWLRREEGQIWSDPHTREESYFG